MDNDIIEQYKDFSAYAVPVIQDRLEQTPTYQILTGGIKKWREGNNKKKKTTSKNKRNMVKNSKKNNRRKKH